MFNENIETNKYYSPYLLEHCNIHQISDDLTLQGYSRAGERTGFIIKSKTKSLDFCLDSGVNTKRKPKHIFLTHSHLDHSGYIRALVPRYYDGTITIYCLDVLKPLIMDHFYHMQKLNDCVDKLNSDNVLPNVKWVLFPYNNPHSIKIENKDIVVKSIKCTHTVPSIGYSFHQIRKRLKKEFHGLKGKDIKKLKESGIDIQEEFTVPLFAFMGDTNIDFMKEYKIDVPILIIECTSFDNFEDNNKDNHKVIQDMYDRGHMHWSQILELAKNYPKTKFVIIHFSPKYSVQFAKEMGKNSGLDNIQIIT